jgi:hypothetical protein
MQLIIMIHFLLLNSRVDVENAITLKFGECIAKEVVLVFKFFKYPLLKILAKKLLDHIM